MAYYTLFVYNADHNKWYQEFGDYDKQTVKDEMDDLKHGYQGILKKHMKIVKSSEDKQDV